MTYAVRPPGRAAYARVGVVLLLAVAGPVGVGAAPSWAGPATALSGVGEARQLVSVGPRIVVAMGAQSTVVATPTPTPAGQVGTNGTSSGTSPRLVVYGLALLTGLLAILALTRRGRPPRGRRPQ